MCVPTKLPWRNMINLTSFALGGAPPGEVSIGQLLDFLGSAPCLKYVEIESPTPTTDTQDSRLVSLEHLEWMSILGDEPCSLLLDHLLIPAGATLSVSAGSFGYRLEYHIPKSLDNLRNLSDFTNIALDFSGFRPDVQFTGPNGRVTVTCTFPQANPTSSVLECLAHIDTSKTERLEIIRGNPPSRDSSYQTLLHMENLHTLKLSRCQSPHFFTRALHPSISSSAAVVCSKLEDLVLVLRTDKETFNIKDLIRMAAARALMGAKLMTVKIVGGQGEPDPGGVFELGKYVLHVYAPGIGGVGDNSNGSVDGSDGGDDFSDDSDEEGGGDSGEDIYSGGSDEDSIEYPEVLYSE